MLTGLGRGALLRVGLVLFFLSLLLRVFGDCDGTLASEQQAGAIAANDESTQPFRLRAV
jgi:hypothetical protein